MILVGRCKRKKGGDEEWEEEEEGIYRMIGV